MRAGAGSSVPWSKTPAHPEAWASHFQAGAVRSSARVVECGPIRRADAAPPIRVCVRRSTDGLIGID
jgi:hypothetical protein